MKLAELEHDALNLLSTIVFPRLSNFVIFHLAHFCVGLVNDADEQFSQLIYLELFRRGLLTAREFGTANIDTSKFTDDDIDSADNWFGDQYGPTVEDDYAHLLLGRDRFAGRMRKQAPPNKDESLDQGLSIRP